MDGEIRLLHVHIHTYMYSVPSGYFFLYNRCGPVSRYWCMRFEAKNSHFKDLAHWNNNFKNIPKLLAKRHGIYNNSGGSGFVSVKNFITGPGTYLYIGNWNSLCNRYIHFFHVLIQLRRHLWKHCLTYLSFVLLSQNWIMKELLTGIIYISYIPL